MCLMIHQPKGLTFSKHDLKDFLAYNADGFGYMYGDGKKLRVGRRTGNPKKLMEMYYREVAGREAVLHFRMATHGPVTVENTHPFPVVPGIAMAHNGILSIGNPMDVSKTDTWHLIKFFIQPVAAQHPDRLFSAKWAEMLGELIGDENRLAFVHADGRIQIVNRASGVTYRGAWMSNEYAWSAPSKYKRYGGVAYSSRSGWTRAEDWGNVTDERTGKDAEHETSDTPYAKDEDLATRALARVQDIYEREGIMEVAAWMSANQFAAASILCMWYKYTAEQAREMVEKELTQAVDCMEEILQTVKNHEDAEQVGEDAFQDGGN